MYSPFKKYLLGFPGGSAGKESACKAGGPGFDPWVGQIPWRRERLPTPVFWLGKFHGLYSPWGCKESDMTERLSLSFISFTFNLKTLYKNKAVNVANKTRIWRLLGDPSRQSPGHLFWRGFEKQSSPQPLIKLHLWLTQCSIIFFPLSWIGYVPPGLFLCKDDKIPMEHILWS